MSEDRKVTLLRAAHRLLKRQDESHYVLNLLMETVRYDDADCLVAIESAMRAGEICSLTWDRVDTERRTATLEKTKNGHGRQVPLSTRAVELIESLRGLDPVRWYKQLSGNPG